MKNASLVLNAVLLVAVVVLYILHFSSGKSGSNASTAYSGPSDLKVAYINEDTVLKYYDYFKENRDKLEEKLKGLEAQFSARQTALQREVQNYQANAGNMTRNQMVAVEEDLQKKGQNLQMYQQSLQTQMAEEQEKIAEELYGKITGFLKEYSKERGIQMVLKYDRGSDILVAGDSLDVSKDVIKGLNEAYKTQKANPTVPAKKDSTAK